MLRMAFLLLVIVGALACVLGVILGVGVWQAARLQEETAQTPATQPASAPASAAAPATVEPARSAEVARIADGDKPRELNKREANAAIDDWPPADPAGRARARVADPAPEPPPAPRPAPDLPPIILAASAATLKGESAKLEGEGATAAIVNWKHRYDTAEWTVEVPRAGLWITEVEYACDPRDGGGAYWLHLGRDRSTVIVSATGGWNEYRTHKLERRYLPAGPTTIRVMPVFLEPERTLMHLRSIRLTLSEELPDRRAFRAAGRE